MKGLIPKLLGLTLTAAALTACGGPGHGTADTNTQSLQKVAQDMARGEDWVSVKDVSHWIIEGHKDFVLIDIRKPDAFAAGHIQGAENVPLAEIMNKDQLAELPTGRKIISYSTDSADAAAATALLRVAGHNAMGMTGGYASWDREILHPNIPPVATTDESPATAEKRAISCYFIGGKGSSNEAPVYVPKKTAPTAPPPPLAPPPGRHNEGC